MNEAVRLAEVHSHPGSGYPVIAMDSLFDPGCGVLRDLIGDRPEALFVTSPTVDRLYGPKIDRYIERHAYSRTWHRIVCPSGEGNKSVDNAMELCAAALRAGIGRLGVFVVIGGGTVIDVAAFAASVYRRGVAHIRIGSTLLGQVDASVGAKCGVNFAENKNFLGAFHPPAAVVVDTDLLGSLDRRQVRAGMAEIIKIGAACDRALLDDVRAWLAATAPDTRRQLLVRTCHRAAALIAVELDQDLFERDLCRSLDFGHTVSPLLEIESGYALNHGEAVAVDMAVSALLAERLGRLSSPAARSLVDLLLAVGLPVWHPALTPDLVARALQKMTAHRGNLNLPLPAPLGAVEFVTHAAQIPADAIDWSVRTVRELAAG